MSKTLKVILLCCLLIFVELLFACGGDPSHEQTLEPTVISSPTGPVPDTLAARIDQHMRDHHQDFSGTILVAQKSKVLISQGYGLADRENEVPNTSQTKFAVGSITKSFTAMAIMILQERELLKVEDPICKYLSDCPDAWKPVTLHHLLNHTSGIPSYTDLFLQGKIDMDLCKEYKTDAVIAYFKDLPLEFTPGSQWDYNNSGYFLLGTVIEKVSGASYDAFIQKSILQPLELTETGYNHAQTIVKNRASGYCADQHRVINAPCWNVSTQYAAGGLYSSVGDLYKWDQALYTDRLVSKETLSKIFTSAVAVDNDVYYGYGWLISQHSGHRVIEHSDWVFGSTAHLARYPDDQVTIIILSNLTTLDHISDGLDLGRFIRELATIVIEEK